RFREGTSGTASKLWSGPAQTGDGARHRPSAARRLQEGVDVVRLPARRWAAGAGVVVGLVALAPAVAGSAPARGAGSHPSPTASTSTTTTTTCPTTTTTTATTGPPPPTATVGSPPPQQQPPPPTPVAPDTIGPVTPPAGDGTGTPSEGAAPDRQSPPAAARP